MARRQTTTAYHDPLNLVRVPSNTLQQDALSVIQSLQQQKSAMQNNNSWKDEFDEIENNLDKWKQRRKTSISNTEKDSFEDSPTSSFQIQTNKSIRSTELKEKISGRSENGEGELSAKVDFQVGKQSREIAHESKLENEVFRRGESLSQVDKKMYSIVDDSLLRSRQSNKPVSEVNKPKQVQGLSKNVTQNYVRKSESRFKNAMAFFEQSSKPESEVVLRSQMSSDSTRINKRMSWAPGMMDKTNRQMPGKLSIANDKEFIIEEIDLNKPRIRMSTTEFRNKLDFTPKFVPNIEINDDDILRRKESNTNSNERKSRVEVISVDFSDKTVPNISLDDFKGIITSPDVIIGQKDSKLINNKENPKNEENGFKKENAFKEKIFIEDNSFKDTILKEDNKEIQYSLSENIMRQNVLEKRTDSDQESDPLNETVPTNKEYQNDNYENNLYKKDKLPTRDEYKQEHFKSDLQYSQSGLESKFSKIDVVKDIQTPISFNENRYTTDRIENLSDALKKRMEDRKVIFNASSNSNDRTEVNLNMKNEKEYVGSSSSQKPIYLEENNNNDQTETHFKLFEETYNKQLEELNERRNKDILMENNMKKVKLDEDEGIEKPDIETFKAKHTFKIEKNIEKLVDNGVSKKKEESIQFIINKEKVPSIDENKNKNVASNWINFKNDINEAEFMSKQNYKIESFLKEETPPKKESKESFESKDQKSKSISSEEGEKALERTVKQTIKPPPKVPPKPMSKTSKIIEKFSSSGFTPVLPVNALPRRSKSMKVLRTPVLTEVLVDEVGIDMEEDWNLSNLLDTTAQKSKSALARCVRRRPPTNSHIKGRLEKAQTFDCSDSSEFEVNHSQASKPIPFGDTGLSREPPILPSKPPPDIISDPRETKTNFDFVTTDDQVDSFSTTQKKRSDKKDDMHSDEEESAV